MKPKAGALCFCKEVPSPTGVMMNAGVVAHGHHLESTHCWINAWAMIKHSEEVF